MKTTPAALLHATAAARAPRGNNLRTMINLHHSSAFFMRDPAEIPTAFETTFRYYKPVYQTYSEYRATAINAVESRANAGLENLAERNQDTYGAKTRAGESSGLVRDVFRGPTSWTKRGHPATADMTERELRVKEALFGTWERGVDGQPRPGLEGVLEILEARGESGWVQEKKEAEEGETEDGM